MKRILTALTLSAVLASPAWSGFIDQKTTWDNMSPIQRLGYIQGVFDMHTQYMAEDNQTWYEIKKHRFDCVLKMKMTAEDLVDLVDTMYRNDVTIWQAPPKLVLLQGLYKMCGC